MIADDLEIIATEVARFSSSYTHVVTSGGIGPTHDDITFEGTTISIKNGQVGIRTKTDYKNKKNAVSWPSSL